MWSNPLYTVKCPKLKPPRNGSIAITPGEYTELGLGAIANYSCDSGFTRIGNRIRGCKFSPGETDTTGMWNSTEPSCQGIPTFLCRDHPTEQLYIDFYVLNAGILVKRPI